MKRTAGGGKRKKVLNKAVFKIDHLDKNIEDNLINNYLKASFVSCISGSTPSNM